MPSRIQRLARGLNEVLSLQGSGEPQFLADQIIGAIDMLQFYGLMQRQTALLNNAAAAEAALVSITPSASSWCVLFYACSTVTVTGTMTALHHNVILQRGGSTDTQIPVASRELQLVGATVTGATHCPYEPPTPRLLPPGAIVSANATIIGTDATASVTIRAEFGTLG